MSIAELKLDLIQKIINTNDVNLLSEIKKILSNSVEIASVANEPSSTYEKIYVFNEWQQERINQALEQFKNGECISNEQAEIELTKWFEEQEK